ncbi:extracellular solute-binding protein [Iocasia frigidifontis]|uniref:Extracellular solute-binding protein n=1 Tax=Iocasia fonsfrigidae TaxID=2682810 RepID=A0A8A7KIG8_9FIRM|nr:extracellular solute-binding protein [Iocasia fonsfrigidae]QTL97934.1 extracellular solute-binding protein [Iocasia fonsfrigidae]
MKKLVVLLTIATMLVFAAVASATEITFWAMTNGPSEAHYEWMAKTAAEFEAETGIKVKFEEIGWDSLNRLTNTVITGEGAQVFQIGNTWQGLFAATGGVLEFDLDDFDEFMGAPLASATYDGKVYGIPWFAETRCLFYNTEMFKKAGITTPPGTWNEVMDAGQKIIDKYGEGSAFAIAGTSAWDLIHNYAMLLWSFGGEMLVDGKAVFNSQAGYDAIDYWVGLLDSGLADPACAEYNQPQANAAFNNGDVAMTITEPSQIPVIADENSDLPYDIVQPPAGPAGRGAFAGGSNIVIRKNAPAEEIEAAKAWVQFLMRKENLVSYCKDQCNFLPTTKEAFNDPYFASGKLVVFKKTLSYAKAYPTLAEWGEIETSIQGNFSNVLTEWVEGNYDENSAEEYLDAAAAEVNLILGN